MKYLIGLIALLTTCCAPKTVVGPQGLPGPAGSMGAQGAQGEVGPTGAAPEDHPDYTVKLCADDTSAYPEYGLEIYDAASGLYQLYAVFENGSGGIGLGYIKPGNYESTLGNGCYFTVNNDGSITQ